MTPIVGYLRMLLDEELGTINKPQSKALRAMDDCVRRLRATLDNLIDVTGLETGKMRFFHRDYDFLDTVRRAVASYADAFAERQLTLLEEMPRGPLPAYGDSDGSRARDEPAARQRLQVRLRRAASWGCACACSRRTTRCSSPTAARACLRSGRSASSSRSTRSTARPRARTAAWAWVSRSRAAWRAAWGATSS
jgi:hypothetical protein